MQSDDTAVKFQDVSEASIRLLVDRFYEKVRKDALLGPIFDTAIGDRWDTHLRTMYDFWSSVMLTSGRYKGNPVAAHAPLPVEPHFFDRWLELFAETADTLFVAEIAGVFQMKSRRIAESLKLALFFRPDRVRVARPS